MISTLLADSELSLNPFGFRVEFQWIVVKISFKNNDLTRPISITLKYKQAVLLYKILRNDIFAKSECCSFAQMQPGT